MKTTRFTKIITFLVISVLLLTQLASLFGVSAAGEFSVSFSSDFAQLGQPLTAVVSDPPSGIQNCQFVWTVDGSVVGGNADSYTPVVANLEKTIQVKVTCNGQSVTASTYFSRLPVVYINTENSAPITSKDYYLNGTMNMQPNAEYSKNLYNGKIEIKGRGNSTWGQPKKPYKIKLDKSTDLMGMGKNKHWVLLANYIDRSLLRNTVAFNLADNFSVESIATVYVVVFLNGEYLGNYQLCEQIRVGETRTNIINWEDMVDDSTNLSSLTTAAGYDLTGGYLMEINSQYDEVSKFRTNNNVPITFKSPEFANTNNEMMNYVRGYLQDYENATLAKDFYNSKGQHYTDLFEIDDLVDYWLVNEFMNNIDSGRWASTYMHKDIGSDKFHMGPIWDFDYSSGNYLHTEFNGYSCPPDHWQYGMQGLWYSKLVGDPLFVARLQERYWEKNSAFAAQAAKSAQLTTLLQESGVKDHTRWGLPSFANETSIVFNWLVARLNWMNAQFTSLPTAMSSLGVYTPDSTVTLKMTTLQDETLAKDTALPSGVVADAVIANGKDVKVTATINHASTTKVNFYLNGILVASQVPMQSGAATATISSDKLVGRGQRNVIQARGVNNSGSFTVSGYTTLATEQYASAESFVWPTVSQPVMVGSSLSDILWETPGNAVYRVGREEVAVPGVFTIQEPKAVSGQEEYTVVFTPNDTKYQTVTAAIHIPVEETEPIVPVILPETIVKNETFQITLRTPAQVLQVLLKNENDMKIVTRVISRKVEGKDAVWVLSLSIGTAGENRKLSVTGKGERTDWALLGSFYMTVITPPSIPRDPGILWVESPEQAVRNQIFQITVATTPELIKGKVYRGTSVIGTTRVARVLTKDELVCVYELALGTAGEQRVFTFKADYDKMNEFPFGQDFTIDILPA